MGSTQQDRADARQRMITVAERLFAERGIEPVSMRLVVSEAGQRNNSAVAYHFGSRDGLVAAIISERSRSIDARRLELIEELEASEQEITAEQVVRVFVRPIAEAADTRGHYVRFLANATDEPGLDLPDDEATHPRGVRWANRQLARSSALPGPVLERRARWMAVTVLRILADHERSLASASANTPVDEIVDDLVLMLAPLFA